MLSCTVSMALRIISSRVSRSATSVMSTRSGLEAVACWVLPAACRRCRCRVRWHSLHRDSGRPLLLFEKAVSGRSRWQDEQIR